MKKLLFCLLILLIPLFVQAKENYQITDYYVSSEIEIAGGLKIKELIVLEGNINGYQHNIDIKNPNLKDYEAGKINFEKSSIYNCTSVGDIKVAAFKVGKKVSMDTLNDIPSYLNEATNTTLGKSDTFTTEETKTGKKVQVYYKGNNQKVAFYYEYVVTNAVVMHNDVAELYYPFLTKNFSEDIKNVQVQVILPFADETDSFHIWAHGPIKGKIQKVQNANKQNMGVLVTAKNLKAKTGLDVRMTFDKELIAIDTFAAKSHQKALPEIEAVENKRTQNTNKTMGQLKTINYIVMGFDIVYVIGAIALGIYTLSMMKKSKSTCKTTEELIDVYNVEEINYLFNQKVTKKDFIASIMYLIYRKNITINEIKTDTDEKDYRLTLKNKDNTTEAEKYLLSIVFEKNKNTTITELKEDVLKTSFASEYKKWQNLVISEAQEKASWENDNSNFKINMIYVILGLIIFAINIAVKSIIWLSAAIIIFTIIYLFWSLLINKKTNDANVNQLNWQSLKEYLEKFENLDKQKLPQVALWNKYLIYSVVFNLIDKLQKQMETIINREKYKNRPNTTDIIKRKYLEIYQVLNKNIKGI